MKTYKHSSAVLLTMMVLASAAALLSISCDVLNFPVEEFFAENTAEVTIPDTQLALDGVSDRVSIGTDGVICLNTAEAGDKVITIPLDNPAGIVLDEAALVSHEEPLPAGVSLAARQSEDKQSIVITVSGALEGVEFTVQVTAKTAKEGRLLFRRELEIACVSFETRLSSLSVPGYDLDLPFDPEEREYGISALIPSTAVFISAVPVNSVVSVSAATKNSDSPPVNVGGQGGGKVFLNQGDNTITITVSAAHGAVSIDYILHLTRSPPTSSSNSIMAFKLAGIAVTAREDSNGVINESNGTIRITVPPGTDITNIEPEVIISGADYEPKGPQNFSTPVVYTVTAGDESAKTYTVTVTEGNPSGTNNGNSSGTNNGGDSSGTNNGNPSDTPSGSEITGFTLSGRSGTVTSTGATTETITVVLPYGVNRDGLTPDITHNGKSIDKSGPQNFSTPVTYTVTAEDSTTRTYTVTVTNAVITSISIETQPSKTVYMVNDNLDTSGMVIRGTDSVGSSHDITGECMRGDYDFSTTGSKTITITHTPSGITGYLNVTVTVTVPGIPAYNMVSVSGGTVSADIGEYGAFSDAGTWPVSVSDFKIGETEITWELWKAVYDWATDSARGSNKYTFANSGQQGYGSGTTSRHPVTTVSWRDAVVWCNAYSEAMGRTPVYKYAGAVLRESESNNIAFGDGKAENAAIDSVAGGFRLPTEAEWEYAARGGMPSAAGPWTYAYAGCNSETDLGDYAWYSANSSGTTHEVKGKTPNRLGLYDMNGNVWELCGDLEYYYGNLYTKIKGGGFLLDEDASYCDIGAVQAWWWFQDDDIGFRVVCSP